ncbi:hypothetical protein LIR51_13775 [Blautia producta]|uniref:hypothetical protein n=1 Tax=Blautia producta TaxID=33035 RepID=UPI001D00BF3C|nr:hypothetical protein [Blautia producta]MCB5875886.1 hypothetical protein [Blautia producta]
MNSKAKGKDGELELVRILKSYGYKDCRRSQQYCGVDGDSDVIGLPGIHAECKRVEKLNIYQAVTQAQGDCRENNLPTVFHRKNRQPWLVTMTMDDWMKLYKAAGKLL